MNIPHTIAVCYQLKKKGCTTLRSQLWCSPHPPRGWTQGNISLGNSWWTVCSRGSLCSRGKSSKWIYSFIPLALWLVMTPYALQTSLYYTNAKCLASFMILISLASPSFIVLNFQLAPSLATLEAFLFFFFLIWINNIFKILDYGSTINVKIFLYSKGRYL